MILTPSLYWENGLCINFYLSWKWKRGKWKESEVAQSCPTLCNPVDCSLPASSVHGLFQARVLEWVAIFFSVKREEGIYKEPTFCYLDYDLVREKKILVNHNAYKFVEAVCRSNPCEVIVHFWSCNQGYTDWFITFNQRHVLSTYCDTGNVLSTANTLWLFMMDFLIQWNSTTKRSVINS